MRISTSAMLTLVAALFVGFVAAEDINASKTMKNKTTALKTEVSDLRYGVVLYHYYQQDYLQSLSELMVADARDGIQGHGDNPELIAGGVSLAFGMQQHAEKIFSELLQEGSTRPQNVRDAAWFYLGKLQYARADYAAAEQSFGRVSDNFSADLQAEMRELKINLQIKRNQFDVLNTKHVEQQKLAGWAPYALYNLGAANARAGNMKSATEFFRELASSPFDESKQARNEYFTLLDKTHVALGHSYLQEKNYNSAIEEFRKVRLDSVESSQALLGYGWAAVAQEKYVEAIKSWQVLQKRNLLYPAAQEALLALPFAYEKLGAFGDALREYQNAEQLLETEINTVRDMRATLTQGELLTLVGSKPVSESDFKTLEKNNDPATLTAIVTNDGQNWLKLAGTSIVKTRSIYLRELFSQNEFQGSVLDLRDLLKLQNLLQTWEKKLTAYTELLQQKQALRQQQTLTLAQQSFGQQEAVLLEKRNALAQRFNAINVNQDYMALADEKTRKTYLAIERSEATLQKLSAMGEDTSEYKDKIAIFKGLLLWNAAQQFEPALIENERSLQSIDESLTQIKTSHENIASITAMGADLQPFFVRIQQQETQVHEQLVQLNLAINIRGDLLRALVDKQLEKHEKRLSRYSAQSHLAVARLYDNALRKQAQ